MTVPPILIQEGTTNVWPNPDGASGTTGLLAFNGTVGTGTDGSITWITVTKTSGSRAFLRTVATPLASTSPGEPWTFQCEARCGTGDSATIRPYITWQDSGGSDIGFSIPTAVVVDDSEWVPFVHTGVAPANTARMVVYFGEPPSPLADSGTVMQFRRIQVENKDHATPVTIGTRPDRYLPGYMDLGSTHIGPLTPH